MPSTLLLTLLSVKYEDNHLVIFSGDTNGVNLDTW